MAEKKKSSVFDKFKTRFENTQGAEMSLQDYFELCSKDSLAYATAAERMVAAIGEPEYVDTSEDPRLSRIFSNRTIKRYKSFDKFYGMEDVIERIVGFFKYSAQGLEESKQILYLLGPVGGGKSSLAEHLKKLMEVHPIYVLAATDENGNAVPSPVLESPLSLFSDPADIQDVSAQYDIPERYFPKILSPWATKRLKEFGGDLTKFKVLKMQPSQRNQIAVTKVEPGDENNQDISTLVGKTDIRKLGVLAQHDADAYSYSGGLNRANQGMLEFVEMFKAPVKLLHPLLTATQEKNYVGTEAIAAMPFNGVILAHSNESEWQSFKNNSDNEAFIDRVCIIKVPYCLRVTEEIEIYKKLLAESALADAVCAPKTLEMLAQIVVLSRLTPTKNSKMFSKMRIYDGESLKDIDPRANSYLDYREEAGVNEGMSGISTRFAFKVLSEVFNYDTREVSANPIHLLKVLEEKIVQEQYPEEREQVLLDYIKSDITPRYLDYIGKELQVHFLESYAEYGQNLFDRYIEYADHWCDDKDYKDHDTGQMYDRATLNAELEKIEKPAGIANPKEFRSEVVKFALRYRANNGENPKWTSYEMLKDVIEQKLFSNVNDILPVISFAPKKSTEDAQKHEEFVGRMKKAGYTERQIRLCVDWYMQAQKQG